MDIKIIDVTVVEVPKKVGQGTNKAMSVAFENITFGGKTDGKKLQDWATEKGVWEALSTAKKGDIFGVTTQKNDRGYIDWVAITPKTAVEVVQEVAVKPARTPTQARQAQGERVAGTWDVKNQLDRERFEFDKEKQGLIIRQSSLAVAATVLTAGGKSPKLQDVVNAAQFFEHYVLNPTDSEWGSEVDTENFPS